MDAFTWVRFTPTGFAWILVFHHNKAQNMIVTICKNKLLAALPRDDLEALSEILEFCELPIHTKLEVAHRPIESIYFIETGVASIAASLPTNLQYEVGVVGSEGMSGASVVLGDTEGPYDCSMQIAGSAYRLARVDFVNLLCQRRSMERFFMKFARLAAIQTGYTALSAGKTKFKYRLARWLLMIHDRIEGDQIEISHDLLGQMLGSHRPAVTDAMHLLQGTGAIRNKRKSIIIKDREILERAAGPIYGPAEKEYERIMGRPMVRPVTIPRQKMRSRPDLHIFHLPN